MSSSVVAALFTTGWSLDVTANALRTLSFAAEYEHDGYTLAQYCCVKYRNQSGPGDFESLLY